MTDYTDLLRDFNVKYQEEVGEDGHNIPKLLAKAKKKRDTAKITEYETDLRIAENLNRLTTSYQPNQSLSSEQCDQFGEGIDSWNHELEYWTSRWYISPFVSAKSLKNQREYVQQLRNTHNGLCKKVTLAKK